MADVLSWLQATRVAQTVAESKLLTAALSATHLVGLTLIVGSAFVSALALTGIAFPLAAIQTTDFLNPETGRTYDFAPGGGLRVAGRLYRKEREILRLGYGVAWAHTANGTSSSNTLQFFRASARLPVTGSFGMGAGYSWYSRRTTYSAFHEGTATQSEWRVFASFRL